MQPRQALDWTRRRSPSWRHRDGQGSSEGQSAGETAPPPTAQPPIELEPFQRRQDGVFSGHLRRRRLDAQNHRQAPDTHLHARRAAVRGDADRGHVRARHHHGDRVGDRAVPGPLCRDAGPPRARHLVGPVAARDVWAGRRRHGAQGRPGCRHPRHQKAGPTGPGKDSLPDVGGQRDRWGVCAGRATAVGSVRGRRRHLESVRD